MERSTHAPGAGWAGDGGATGGPADGPAFQLEAVYPRSADEVQEWVRRRPCLLARGGGTKWDAAGLGPGQPLTVVDTRYLSGVVEYDPAEFTLTVGAGTPLAMVEGLLAQHGQYLPFDPLLVDAGATVGGTVATGASGAGRLRFGGVRDFVLGVRLVDGSGRLVRGGGRVVKNAAGFDVPKLLCGSQGRLGVITEVTLKVLPRPEAFASGRFRFRDVGQAASAVRALYRSPVEAHAIELAAPGILDGFYTLLVRVGGPEATLSRWLNRVARTVWDASAPVEGDVQWEPSPPSPWGQPGQPAAQAPPSPALGGGASAIPTGSDAGAGEAALWRGLRELAWARTADGRFAGPLVRIYAQPSAIEALDRLLAAHGARRWFSQAGNILWALFPEPPSWSRLARDLTAANTPALCWWAGPPGISYLVPPAGTSVAEAVKGAFDPEGRFPPFGWNSMGGVTDSPSR